MYTIWKEKRCIWRTKNVQGISLFQFKEGGIGCLEPCSGPNLDTFELLEMPSRKSSGMYIRVILKRDSEKRKKSNNSYNS